MADLREFHGPNAGYVLDLYERFLRDPSGVEAGWRAFFQDFAPPAQEAADGAASPADLAAGLAANRLADAIRARGHTSARLDPLGFEAEPDPALRPEAHGVSEADLRRLPAAVIDGPAASGARSAAEALERLRGAYSGSIGYEFEHLSHAEERAWLRDAVEGGRVDTALSAEQGRALLARLSEVEGFEKFLHRAFFGQKRFSIEGTDAMVPMLDAVIDEAAGAGAAEVLVGMAHRGRLNVLTHVLGKPYQKILAGFASGAAVPPSDGADVPSGDVKYHMGWRDVREVDGREIAVTLAPNPSHLEFVNPVIIGMTRAAQDRTDAAGRPEVEFGAALAILIHGDAAFPGQGVVAETFNMSGLPGYAVGGTIHLIANNQVGFTTRPEQGRSTRYSSDTAKGFEVPVAHVNADDAAACLAVARLACRYRARFHKDFVIDLVGYRRWGHNEGDEPLFTQPVMYERVRTHPTAREALAERLAADGMLEGGEADTILTSVTERLGAVLEALGAGEPAPQPASPSRNGGADAAPGTAVQAETLRSLNGAMLRRPQGFTPNTRLDKVLQRREEAMGDEGGIDWGHAESLAFASLLAEGTPVRLSGQDVERGTFSHRHLVLHDARTGDRLDVLAQLPEARASFEVLNSPLSEMAVVGFEYGYSVADPAVLVLWEAQFGDFVNGAQVIIDQFLAAGEQKWEQRSGLTLLLPHGYEGQGPEHSSARLERFLQLAAENNVRVAYPTTAAQYFHLLRRQAALLRTDPRPLVVMSPKSLLRHPLAASRLEQLAGGSFQPLLADPAAVGRAAGVTRLLLCSGKVYLDLTGTGEEQQAERAAISGVERVALARVEELYPFPSAEITEMIAGYPALREIVWVQEEPRNMGAWSFAEPRLREIAGDTPVRYVGRPERASPAEGLAHRHTAEQARIVRTAWSDAPGAAAEDAPRPRGGSRRGQPA